MRAFVGLGSNLGGPVDQVKRALAALAALPQSRMVSHSGLYGSKPWGGVEQPAFVNAVAELETSLQSRALLDALLEIEHAQGRRRGGERWGPRVIDLDLLCYGTAEVDEPGLRLPHPHIAERSFVLVPLAEIAADLAIPGIGAVSTLLARIDTRDCLPIA
ncbi:2-amino-4-hydroxy-6-hydroxymethyldihydropteridine diphosphokinase [Dokdonella sp.]|uniref:2-amino-4-hydroxy-6- hydroxymethyldihydropteridine diphosphokinase n=1 Tax=Dokdonella sp. TaxID=2291710 RepID=UPI003264119B